MATKLTSKGQVTVPKNVRDYLGRKGTKQGVLPNFYIGAHAAVMRWPLLTRDAGRYRGYFRTVRLITPG